ncbi:hypothetical protein Tco_1036047 [Tanacetum coccineum]
MAEQKGWSGAPRNQGNRNRDVFRRIVPIETPANALVIQDGIGGYDWSFQAEEGPTDFALMTHLSSGSSISSSSDSEKEQLKKSNLEIIGYQLGLESLEARIVIHEKNEASCEESIAFLKYDVQVKDISIKNLKNQLEEALKEKDDLKLKLENFEESSKNLIKLINSQISVKDKTGLGQPKLGLWYPRDSPFDLEAFSDSDYAGASLDRKSTTGGCQFLGKRLISWQCKKQTIVANSTTEAEYVAAANCCGQVLWIQNQMLDYGFNFMNTKIYIDNESTICIVKNLVFHSKTKHIEIRHHFIRDCYEKKLIQVIKIHTDHNVADLLTKAFDVSRFNFLIASIGLLNL